MVKYDFPYIYQNYGLPILRRYYINCLSIKAGELSVLILKHCLLKNVVSNNGPV